MEQSQSKYRFGNFEYNGNVLIGVWHTDTSFIYKQRLWFLKGGEWYFN
jgi:hypothetical protein